ncbi:uncharacterized protein LOC119320672 [Triticum dicoccoides]|uniref:uncharacterized protein LOC119320672 n=1 Tax=Triticum dicoccoides TaxID=85692 RepID=UPI001891D6BE|nr:uncharacterized protein LOC119320672 [Triticum dicoccoides]
MAEHRCRISFSTARSPVPLDIFSCSLSPLSTEDELLLTDGVSYNYNGCPIPPAALKTLLKNPKVASESEATDADIDAGHVSGIFFVSERDDDLETLYIALRFNADGKVKIFSLADIFGTADFSGIRLENSCSIGGGYSMGSRTIDHSLIYVSTKEPVHKRHSPGTAVYKTNLRTGKTERLTPRGMFDLSPAVSPSGKKVAVASFRWNRWDGEVEKLETDICVMNVDREECRGLGRSLIIRDGGWPSWGSDNIIFFHRGVKKFSEGMGETSWAVFRYNISTKETMLVTPHGLDAVTPAAISDTKVAVATIRQEPLIGDASVDVQYRHIEIFDTSTAELPPVCITQAMRPKCDHYNPFVLDGGGLIGYHRCVSDQLQHGDRTHRNLFQPESPVNDVGLHCLSVISPGRYTLAFINNEFNEVCVADSQGLRLIYKKRGLNSILAAVWNQNPMNDTLYICVGTSFSTDIDMPLEIYCIMNASAQPRYLKVSRLTNGEFNNAFPSSKPQGNKLVFRSTRDGGKKKHKNLYIMEDASCGEYGEGTMTRLTMGPWTDTHCMWSPQGDWIVFSSTCDKPYDAAKVDNSLDPGHFSVFLVNLQDPMVVIRVMNSDGHIHRPVFSPDMRSIAVTADLAAVSVEPISLPRYSHPLRSYGNISVVDIDTKDLMEKKYIKGPRYLHPMCSNVFVVDMEPENLTKTEHLGPRPGARKYFLLPTALY